MDLELAGRVAIVTGGSRGIGKAIAFELAREGVDLALCAREMATLEATAAEIAAATGRVVVPISVDTTDRVQVDAAVAQVVGRFGKIDILVNSAGVPGGLANGPLPTIDDAALTADFEAKTFGTLRFCRAVAPQMQAQGWGRIINIGGLSGRMAGAYSGGMRNVSITHLTRTLSLELAPSGITVNVVHPGMTRTEYTRQLWADQASTRGITAEEAEQQAASRALMGRVIDATEVAYLVAFLASPRAAAVSGEAIGVGGGEPARALFL